MIRNQFNGEDAEYFAREMCDLYRAGWDLSNVAAPVDVEDYPDPSVYVWLKHVSDAMKRFVETAYPLHQRLGLTQVPLTSLKQASEFCRAIERAEFFGIDEDPIYDSSSPVGGCCGHCQPTGEGFSSGSGEGVE